MFERVIVDEHGKTQRDCLENVREIRKYRTRLANRSEDDVILRGLVYMNQFHYVERARQKTQTVDVENFCPGSPFEPSFSPRRGLLLCSTIR